MKRLRKYLQKNEYSYYAPLYSGNGLRLYSYVPINFVIKIDRSLIEITSLVIFRGDFDAALSRGKRKVHIHIKQLIIQLTGVV